MNPLEQVEQRVREQSAEILEEAARARVSRRPVAHVCGINHTRAGIGVLERYALSPEQAAEALGRIVAQAGTDQAMVLSTCNRTEFYGWSSCADFARRLRGVLLGIGAEAAPEDEIAPIYEYRGAEAVRHLFAVESGLDSMILGENYIKQQIKQAWEMSQARGAAGPELNRTAQAALRCGKRIRTETRLNEGTLESDIAAILKAEQVLGTLAGKTCLVIGAGKIGRRAARAISEREPARLVIVNRTVATAREIADACGGEAHGMDALAGILPEADFVLGAAYAPEFIVRHPVYVEALRRRGEGRARTVCMVDTAMPRIFDPDLALLPNVRLFDLEHMQGIVARNRELRVVAARDGWRIVEEELEKYRQAQLQAELAPAIRRLQAQFDKVFGEERDALEAYAQSESECRKLEAIQHRIKQRLLHEVIVEMKANLEDA